MVVVPAIPHHRPAPPDPPRSREQSEVRDAGEPESAAVTTGSPTIRGEPLSPCHGHAAWRVHDRNTSIAESCYNAYPDPQVPQACEARPVTHNAASEATIAHSRDTEIRVALLAGSAWRLSANVFAATGAIREFVEVPRRARKAHVCSARLSAVEGHADPIIAAPRRVAALKGGPCPWVRIGAVWRSIDGGAWMVSSCWVRRLVLLRQRAVV